MRTTLISTYARRSLKPTSLRDDDGFPLFDVADDASAITSRHVARALDEWR